MTVEPSEPVTFGLVGCLIEPDRPGPAFRMTVNDQTDGMIVRTNLMRLHLPRDHDMTDEFTHVGSLTDGERGMIVALDQNLWASFVSITEGGTIVSTGEGQCEAI